MKTFATSFDGDDDDDDNDDDDYDYYYYYNDSDHDYLKKMSSVTLRHVCTGFVMFSESYTNVSAILPHTSCFR